MRIGIDLDDILADLVPALIKYHNFAYGTKLKRDQFTSYGYWKIWGGTKNEAIQKLYKFSKTSYFKNIKPVSGAQKAIPILKQNNDLYIVTSRRNEFIDKTLEWIDNYFPNTFTDIYFANHYSQSGKSITKSQICDQAKLDILIEDSVEYALECLAPKRKIFLLDCPWNQYPKLPQEIHRFYSWDEIIKAI